MEASEHTLQNEAATQSFSQRLLHASYHKAAEFKRHVPSTELIQLLDKATAMLKQEPTLLELTMEADCRVLMVGDTHGQLHDVVHMMELMGPPSQNQMYIFNGDFVDRGAWGVELLALLLSLKLEHRARVHLLRGNHEGSTCTRFYGFKGELDAKYGGPESRAVYAAYKRVFAVLPLAALVHGKTLILHGGLFRYVAPPEPKEQQQGRGKAGSKAKRRRVAAADPLAPLLIGNLSVLRGASKGGVDPDGRGSSAVAADVLWSDPVMDLGLRENELRGVGLTFGPDITQAFLEANDLRLILRSHEGPDARDRREDLPQVLQGYALDHDTPAGRLMTVFSAPDYPQFMSSHETRYNNKGAVAVLSGPTWHEPHMVSFEAARPRPEATAFYEYETYPDTDDELMAEELGAASSQGGGSSISEVGALARGGEEVTSQIVDPGCSASTEPLADAGEVRRLLDTTVHPVLVPAALAPATAGAAPSSTRTPDTAGEPFTAGVPATAAEPTAVAAGPFPLAAPAHSPSQLLLPEAPQHPSTSRGHAATAPPPAAPSAAEGAGASEQGPLATLAASASQTSPLAPPLHPAPPAAPAAETAPAPAPASYAAAVQGGSVGPPLPLSELDHMQALLGLAAGAAQGQRTVGFQPGYLGEGSAIGREGSCKEAAPMRLALSTAHVTANGGHSGRRGSPGSDASAVQNRRQLVLSPDMQQQLLAILQQPQQGVQHAQLQHQLLQQLLGQQQEGQHREGPAISQPQQQEQQQPQQQQSKWQGCESPSQGSHDQRQEHQGAKDAAAPIGSSHAAAPCDCQAPPSDHIAHPSDCGAPHSERHIAPPCDIGAHPCGREVPPNDHTTARDQGGQQQGQGQESMGPSSQGLEGEGMAAQQPAQAWQVPAGAVASHIFAVASPGKSNGR